MDLFERYSKQLNKFTNGIVSPDRQDFMKMVAFYTAVEQEEKSVSKSKAAEKQRLDDQARKKGFEL